MEAEQIQPALTLDQHFAKAGFEPCGTKEFSWGSGDDPGVKTTPGAPGKSETIMRGLEFCMESVESSVKKQFARKFVGSDWRLFKSMAEFYLRQAAFLRTRDLRAYARPKLRLLARNSQKRLFIGVGIELLLKALYLKSGYVINLPAPGKTILKFPFTIAQLDSAPLVEGKTFMLDPLIAHIGKVIDLSDSKTVLKGLRIAQVFRNKEGHSVTPRHIFEPSNYRDIERALTELYRQAFHETLRIRFSLGPSEKALWRIRLESEG